MLMILSFKSIANFRIMAQCFSLDCLLSPIDLIFGRVIQLGDVFDNFQAVDLGTSVQYSPPAGIDSAWNATQVSEAIILGLFSAA